MKVSAGRRAPQFSRKAAPPQARTPGFTLVELMLVITIIAIMTAVALPNMRSSLFRNPLKNATDSISRLVDYARSEAILRNQEVRMTFDQENGEIVIEALANSMQAEEPLVTLEPPLQQVEGFGDTVNLREIVKNTLTETGQPNRITFNPDGSTNDTMIYLVQQDDNETRVHTIGIVGLTGQVITWQREVLTLYEEEPA